MTNGFVENIAPIENLMEPDSLTHRVGETLILCEQIYLGFKTAIDKTIVESMNGPTRPPDQEHHPPQPSRLKGGVSMTSIDK